MFIDLPQLSYLWYTYAEITQSANVLALSWQQYRQYHSCNDDPQPRCEFEVGCPFMWIRSHDKPEAMIRGSRLETRNTFVLGLLLNHIDDPVLMAVPKPLLIKLAFIMGLQSYALLLKQIIYFAGNALLRFNHENGYHDWSMTMVTSMTTDKTERKQQFHLLSFDYHFAQGGKEWSCKRLSNPTIQYILANDSNLWSGQSKSEMHTINNK